MNPLHRGAPLAAYPENKRKGEVVRSTNFTNAVKPMRAKLGYRYLTKGKDGKPLNPEGPEYPEDVLRHSYASHWLALHPNRGQLAEDMGNTVEVIKRHYKKVVGKKEGVAYTEILPAGMVAEKKRKSEEIEDLTGKIEIELFPDDLAS